MWKRHPTEPSHYRLMSQDGMVLAHAVLTGRRGVDDYPWDWYVEQSVGITDGRRLSGVADTLRSAKEYVEIALR